jgi:hypothetical protein
MRIFAVAPITSKALQALQRDGWTFVGTPVDRGDGYCRLVKLMPESEIEKLAKVGITVWAERKTPQIP